MVVDRVDDHAETAGVAGVDEPFQPVRPAVRLVRGEPADAVVPPVVLAVERVHRQQFDQVDAEIDEVVEALDRGVERAGRRERADVQFVDDGARPAHDRSSPASVQSNAAWS